MYYIPFLLSVNGIVKATFDKKILCISINNEREAQTHPLSLKMCMKVTKEIEPLLTVCSFKFRTMKGKQ